MVFADVGDRLRLDPRGNGFSVLGPFSATLAQETDNLVTRARDRFADIFGQAPVGFELEKRLPIAAGLGGGSSDAAAALRLLADERGVSHDDPRLAEIARGLGADVPACLKAEPVVGRGRGDDLSPAPPFASLPALLVNPGAPCPTGAVYRAFDASEVNHSLEAPLPRRSRWTRGGRKVADANAQRSGAGRDRLDACCSRGAGGAGGRTRNAAGANVWLGINSVRDLRHARAGRKRR